MLEQKITEWLEQELELQKLFLVDVQILPAGKILIFVDGDENVTIEQCAHISRYLERYLDVEEGVPESYTLEVSSPGMNNPLKLPRQYKKRIGHILDVTRIDGSSEEVILLDADDMKIVVEKAPEWVIRGKLKQRKKRSADAEQFEIPYSEIKRSLLQFNSKG